MKGDLVLVVAASASVHRQPFHVDRVALGLQGLDKLVCLSATHGRSMTLSLHILLIAEVELTGLGDPTDGVVLAQDISLAII